MSTQIAKPRIGLVGAGGISRAHAPALRQSGLPVSVFSLDGGAQLAADFGFRTVGSWEELLDSSDIIDIVTPTFTHQSLALAAITAGKDVVCEKPLALTTGAAVEIAQAAAAAGVKIFPAHVVRYFPAYVGAREQILAGRLGKMAVLRFTRGGAFPQWAPWFADLEQSGGVISDLMVHDFDQALWMAGPVKEVFCSRVCELDKDCPQDIAQVILTHESGAMSYVRGIWGAANLQFQTSFHLSGTLGQLIFSSVEPNRLRMNGFRDSTGGGIPLGMVPDPYTEEINDFIAGCAGNSVPMVDAWAGVAAVEIAEAAHLSAATGEPVNVPLSNWRQSRANPEPGVNTDGERN